MLHLCHHLHKPFSITLSRFNLKPCSISQTISFSPTMSANEFPSFNRPTLVSTPKCTQQWAYSNADNARKITEKINDVQKIQEGDKRNFWGAVSLIIGTAVGPGMLGLPAPTMKSGSFPSTIAILLCWVYVISSVILVAELTFVARTNILDSFALSSWKISTILPSIPVTVLTLGFHVITPFICKIAGNTVSEARKAVLIGGAVPLIMVLSWNLIVLGLAGANSVASTSDPITILLSVNPSALSAVQGFAFSALATSLIGYAVTFPKQLLDTLGLIFTQSKAEKHIRRQSQAFSDVLGNARVGLVIFSSEPAHGNSGRALFNASRCSAASEAELRVSTSADLKNHKLVTIMVLGVPILIGSFYRSTFSTALDFAGVYANCFLFGILPPVMAYLQKSRRKLRSSSLPGGDATLLILFSIAVILGIWH